MDTTYITELREEIGKMLTKLKTEVQTGTPPAVQELVLAQRHLEDARMRLGVADAYYKGFDPWSSRVDEGSNSNQPSA